VGKRIEDFIPEKRFTSHQQMNLSQPSFIQLLRNLYKYYILLENVEMINPSINDNFDMYV